MPNIDGLRVGVTLILCDIGQTDEARRRLAEERAQSFELADGEPWFAAMSSLADVAVDLDDRPSLDLLLPLLAPHATRISMTHAIEPTVLARPLARVRGALDRHDEADALFTAALRIYEELGSPHWIARTRVDRGQWLLRRNEPGDSERAAADFAAALALAQPIGAGSISQRVERLRAAS